MQATADELLCGVQALVGKVARDKYEHILRRHVAQPPGDFVEGLVPGDFAEVPAAFKHGLARPLVVMRHLGQAEAPPHAELSVVDLRIEVGLGAREPRVFVVQLELTAQRAERARRDGGPVRLAVPLRGFVRQGAGRAHRDAGAAKLAPGFDVALRERRADLGPRTRCLKARTLAPRTSWQHPDTTPQRMHRL